MPTQETSGNIKQLSGPEKLLPPWIISMPPLSRNGPLGSWTNTYRNNHNLCLCDTAPRSLFITFSTFLFTTTTSTLLLNRYVITPIWGTRKPLWAFTRFPYYLLFFPIRPSPLFFSFSVECVSWCWDGPSDWKKKNLKKNTRSLGIGGPCTPGWRSTFTYLN